MEGSRRGWGQWGRGWERDGLELCMGEGEEVRVIRGRSRNFKRGVRWNFLQKGGGGVQPLTREQFVLRINKIWGGGGVRTSWTPPWICPGDWRLQLEGWLEGAEVIEGLGGEVGSRGSRRGQRQLEGAGQSEGVRVIRGGGGTWRGWGQSEQLEGVGESEQLEGVGAVGGGGSSWRGWGQLEGVGAVGGGV